MVATRLCVCFLIAICFLLDFDTTGVFYISHKGDDTNLFFLEHRQTIIIISTCLFFHYSLPILYIYVNTSHLEVFVKLTTLMKQLDKIV